MTKYSYINPTNASAVTPSDSLDLTAPSAIYCGGTGDIKVSAAKGSADVTFGNVQAGTTLDLIATRVWSTGTTCSGIIAMW